MPIDCHTHVGAAEHYSGQFAADLAKAWGEVRWEGRTLEDHWEAVRGAERAIVVAFDAPAAGFEVSNEYVANYVAQHPEKLIGFASVDPNRADGVERLRHAVETLPLRGLKLAPIYQDANPVGPGAMALYGEAERLGIPVLTHMATTFVQKSPLRHARPWLMDEVGIAFPGLAICLAHLGHPWCEENMAVIRKHPRMYSDVSALHTRPMQFYLALNAAVEYRVTDKILLGSDYPFSTLEQSIDALRNVNAVVAGTGMPPIPAEVIEGIIERDSVTLLGLD